MHKEKFFDIARLEAQKSDFKNFHIGCILVYKGHIIGRGHNSNKTHPCQKKYNKYRKFKKSEKPIKHSLHAEMAALNSVPYPIDKEIDWSHVKVFIYRISKGNSLPFGLARPCPACEAALRDKGIRKIWYTTNSGFAREELY